MKRFNHIVLTTVAAGVLMLVMSAAGCPGNEPPPPADDNVSSTVELDDLEHGDTEDCDGDDIASHQVTECPQLLATAGAATPKRVAGTPRSTPKSTPKTTPRRTPRR